MKKCCINTPYANIYIGPTLQPNTQMLRVKTSMYSALTRYFKFNFHRIFHWMEPNNRSAPPKLPIATNIPPLSSLSVMSDFIRKQSDIVVADIWKKFTIIITIESLLVTSSFINYISCFILD